MSSNFGLNQPKLQTAEHYISNSHLHQNQNSPLTHYTSTCTISNNKKDNKNQDAKIYGSSFVRYSSEQDFKKYQQNLQHQKMHVPVYINGCPGEQEEDYKVSIGSKGSKGSGGSFGEESNKITNKLKQTSSTNSQSITKKQLPAFLKSKSKVILQNFKNKSRFTRDSFRIYKKLGEGKFGKVYLVKQLTTGYILAMKVIEKKKIIQDGLLEQFIRQLKIQTFLRHPNIIEMYGFFDDQKYFYTLMELGCDGQLYNLCNEKKSLTEEATSFITKNLLQAVDYMHSLKILHRDIKPENIVRIMGNVKICDFGWAANKLTKQELRSTYCGTPLYLSPQILSGEKYDQKVDLWAVGILAYELMLGKSPFQIHDQGDLYKIMTDQVVFPVQKKVSKEFEEFTISILDKNPKKRLNSSELLQLKFIQKYEAFETCEQLCN